ncbi:MAG: Gp49 family protein [Thiolinea sp.]
MSNEQNIEQQLQDKGLNAPRLSPELIDSVIESESYVVLPSGKSMICELMLRNGYSVRGESSVVRKENFDEAIGRKISRENAREKIWQLEGYLLQQRLWEAQQ